MPINIDELLKWNLEQGTQIGQEVESVLNQKREEYVQYSNPKNRKRGQPEVTEEEFMRIEESLF